MIESPKSSKSFDNLKKILCRFVFTVATLRLTDLIFTQLTAIFFHEKKNPLIGH